jgi:hypothetical protein
VGSPWSLDARGSVGGHLVGARLLEGAGEEPTGGHQIPYLGYLYVDDLTELIDHPYR